MINREVKNMRASFKNAPSPVAASVVRERTIKDAIGAIKNSFLFHFIYPCKFVYSIKAPSITVHNFF